MDQSENSKLKNNKPRNRSRSRSKSPSNVKFNFKNKEKKKSNFVKPKNNNVFNAEEDEEYTIKDTINLNRENKDFISKENSYMVNNNDNSDNNSQISNNNHSDISDNTINLSKTNSKIEPKNVESEVDEDEIQEENIDEVKDLGIRNYPTFGQVNESKEFKQKKNNLNENRNSKNFQSFGISQKQKQKELVKKESLHLNDITEALEENANISNVLNNNYIPKKKKKSKNISEKIIKKKPNNSDEVIQLIKIDNNRKIIVNENAWNIIKNIKKKICILTIVGPYRTGKSYLLNRFANKQHGFETGDSTNPCTEGIWIWGSPIDIDNELCMILMDTEGLNSYNRDEEIDAIMFLLSSILSTTLIYNTFGIVDKDALEQLNFITNLTKLFKKEGKRDIHKYFPKFYWVLRDFSLDLKDPLTEEEISENQYLELALMPNNKENSELNSIKNNIKEFFIDRNCKTLIRPINDESLLRKIENITYNQLKKDFRHKSEELINEVKNNLLPKVVDNVPVNGNSYCDFINLIVHFINNKGIPKIESTWERIIHNDIKNTLKNALKNFQDLSKILLKKLPLDESIFYKKLEINKNESIKLLLNLKYSSNKVNPMVDLFEKKMQSIEDDLIKENYNKSKEICIKILEEIKENLLEKINLIINKEEKINISFFQNVIKYVSTIYLDNAVGPAKYIILNDNFTSEVGKFIDKSFQIKSNHYQEASFEFEKQISILEGKYNALKSQNKDQKDMFDKLINETKSFNLNNFKLTEKLMMNKQSNNTNTSSPGYNNELIKSVKEQNNSVIQEVSKLKNSLNLLKNILQNNINENYDNVIQKLVDKEKIIISKEYKAKSDSLKYETEINMEIMRKEFNNNLRQLKDKVHSWELNNQELQTDNIKKSGEIKVLKEKILSEEKLKSKQIEFSSLLGSTTENLIRLMNKIDDKIN